MDLMDIAIAKGMANNSSGNGSSSSGSGSGAYIVHGVKTGYLNEESGTMEYVIETEKTAGEIFELACNGPVIINAAVGTNFSGSTVTTEVSMLVLFCAKALVTFNGVSDYLISLAYYTFDSQNIKRDTYPMDYPIYIGDPPIEPDPPEDPNQPAGK